MLTALSDQLPLMPTLQKSTMAILDQFVVGNEQDKKVLCEVIDADTDGIPPDDDSFNCDSPCLLDVIVKSDNKVWVNVDVYKINNNIFQILACG